MSAPVIRIIVEQHAEEAAFLWLLRDAAVRAPHYSLKDLTHLDARVEAHLDGLRVAGIEGWEICRQTLALEEPGEIFATTVLAFESSDRERIRTAVTAGCTSPETLRGLISALGWLPYSQIEPWVQRLLATQSPAYRRIGIAACAVHRQDPGVALTACLNDPDPLLVARALRAVGELKRRDLLPVLRQRFMSEDDSCRFWAAWSATLLNDASGIGPLKLFVETGSPFQERALQLVLRVMEPSRAMNWLKGLGRDAKLHRTVVKGAGILGDPALIPWLIQVMPSPPLARLAGESFTMITGVDIAYEDLEGEWPEGFEAGPTDNPEDEDVTMDADEDLPWPNPHLISAWWAAHQHQFQPGTRYLMGKPIEIQHLHGILVTGYQRQRQAAALELALRQPNIPLFETRAPGPRQQEFLRRGTVGSEWNKGVK